LLDSSFDVGDGVLFALGVVASASTLSNVLIQLALV